MKRLRLKQVLVVEGRYDAAVLADVVDGLILTTDGFSIYSNREKKELLKTLGRKRGLVILTDSDAAGFQIRHYLQQIAAGSEIYHAYVPAVPGKEKRKQAPSKEGLLGVEGFSPSALADALRRAGVTLEEKSRTEERRLTYTDLYEWGLSGTKGSAERRRLLLERIAVPPRLSKRALLEVLNSLYSYEELKRLVQEKPVLFWDFHGTLTLPDVVWFDAAMEAAAEQAPGPPLAREMLIKYFGGTCLPWFSVPGGDTRHLRGSKAWWAHCEGEFEAMFQKCGFTEQQAARIAPALREKVLQPHRYHLRPGVAQTLAQLQKRGYRNFILSNNFPELPSLAKELGLAPYFEKVLVSGLVGFEKPREELFRYALEAAGAPPQAWMIGDNPEDDIRGGKAAGMTTVYLGTSPLPAADYSIGAPEDILGLLL